MFEAEEVARRVPTTRAVRRFLHLVWEPILTRRMGVEGRRRVIRSESGSATERFDLAPRALFEIGRRNLFGSNRSANLFMSLSRSVTNPLTEYRIVATVREPHLFNTTADAFVNATLEQQHRSARALG